MANDLDVIQMDVNSAFLQATLEEEVYIRQPEGFIYPDRPHAVYQLRKSLYGLRQAPRMWNKEMHKYLILIGFERISANPCVYVKEAEKGIVIIGLYVNNNLIIGNRELIQWTQKMLASCFPMKDLGPAKSFLGMECIIVKERGEISLRQSGFIRDILKQYRLDDCNPCATPMEERLQLPRLDETPNDCKSIPYREIVGKLLYVSIATRLDIAYAVNYISRFVNGYGHPHWKTVQRILRYLKGTIDYGITYSKHAPSPMVLHGYGDADWGGDHIDRKSISGFLFFLAGGPISWRVRKQVTVALSSTEAEYLAATDSAKQAIHHRRFLHQIGKTQTTPTVIAADNKGAISLSENFGFHERTKHFGIRHHFIREKVDSGEITLKYCPTQDMVADIMTKALPKSKFEKLRREAGVNLIVGPRSTS